MFFGNANVSSRLYPPLRGRPASPDGFGIGGNPSVSGPSLVEVSDVSDDESSVVDVNVTRFLCLNSTPVKFIRGVMIGTAAGRSGKNCMRGVINGRCRCIMFHRPPQHWLVIYTFVMTTIT
jgi:hypothetical protein